MFSLSHLPISMEKHLSPENVNLHGGIARSFAGRLVSDKYVINCVAAAGVSQNICGKHQLEYQRNSKRNIRLLLLILLSCLLVILPTQARQRRLYDTWAVGLIASNHL